MWASHKATPSEALWRAILGSRDPMTWLFEGRVLCIYGMSNANILAGIGSPWLLCSEELPDHAVAFYRTSRLWFEDFTKGYGLLVNYADARNTLALRWLAWLGFEIMDAEPHGWLKLPFHRFQMEKN